ncbi:MAG: hypothetical protein A2297_03080 [Elusimicrobia bacterium RIFOXYB2_FULL_48_7]|nr:MAG: hypothetical protein A2297_03080 [Elusimicrobia bacterium RIFOXYB2_FULL_48_7]
MELLVVLGLPVALALIPLVIKEIRKIAVYHTAGYFVLMIFSLVLAGRLTGRSISYRDFFYADALSGFFVLLISLVSFIASLYSVNYIGEDVRDNIISNRKARLYYLLFDMFVFTMFFSTVVDNLGIIWVSIEMTTLTSAFLVGFYNKKESVEAAWKYIIICSVGIALALFGTILFYYTASLNAGVHSLNWTEISAVSAKLNPNVLKIAFLFILVGFGTKAGLAPMHTWLPDAHSQAVTPVSALLSGVLLKTALYAILRYMIIVNKCIGPEFTGNLLVFLGLISLVVAAVFIIVQKDIKRLLAYSSIEHIGIIAVGIGFGTWLGYYGALLHMFNHAVTKSLMFFGAGNIIKKYRSHNIRQITGVLQSMPLTGFMLLIGVFALSGSPPFSIFLSEIMVLIAGFTGKSFAACFIFLACIAVIFAGLIFHFSGLLFGKKPAAMQVFVEPMSNKILFIFLGIIMVYFGLAIPEYFNNILKASINILQVM